MRQSYQISKLYVPSLPPHDLRKNTANKEQNLIIAEFTLQLLATSQQTPTFPGYLKFTEKEPSAKMRNYTSSSVEVITCLCILPILCVFLLVLSTKPLKCHSNFVSQMRGGECAQRLLWNPLASFTKQE